MSSFPSLQQIAFSKVVGRYFDDPADPENAFLAESLRDVFRSTLKNQQVRIREIIDRATADLKEMMASLRADPSRGEEMRIALHPNGPFGNRWLSELYQNGGSEFNWYVFHHYRGPARNELTDLCNNWLQSVKNDFEAGKPHSFHQMARWMQERQISDFTFLAQQEPFDQPAKFLPLLKKMAYLGVPEAQDALSWAYDRNVIGYDSAQIQLNFTLKERIDGIKALIHWGHCFSQDALGAAYFSNYLEGVRGVFSEKERRAGMEELARIELQPNYYVTRSFVENRIGELACNFTLEERLVQLTQKAKKGNREALSYLWEAYAKNQMGDKAIDLPLNEQERWEKLQELRTEQNEKSFNDLYASWVIEPTELLPCRMTLDERMRCLETLGFEKSCNKAARFLATCYSNDLWDHTTRINIPFVERLEKLEILATTHCSRDAMWSLCRLYFPEHTEHYSGINEIEGVPGSVRAELGRKSIQEKADFIYDLGFRGEHWDIIKAIPPCNMQDSRLQTIFDLAGVHLEALGFISRRLC